MKGKGYIGYFGLEDWWIYEFTEEERLYMDEKYDRDDWESHQLTQADISYVSIPVTTWLNGLLSFFRRKEDKSIAERIHKKIDELGEIQPIDKPGYYKGRHFTTWVDDVKELKRSGNIDQAEILLVELVKATEAEVGGVAPWYYEELAKIYRNQKTYDKEIEILERFANQRHSPGKKTTRLLERLNKAKYYQ